MEKVSEYERQKREEREERLLHPQRSKMARNFPVSMMLLK
jgi:hypothetical protein